MQAAVAVELARPDKMEPPAATDAEEMVYRFLEHFTPVGEALDTITAEVVWQIQLWVAWAAGEAVAQIQPVEETDSLIPVAEAAAMEYLNKLVAQAAAVS
jgi:hypothetical protein